ncbi:MAG: hypothetical protein QOG80_2502 [Pseudonocardiales bacterium]|nr:hypothetical protein [Pseudonocardiales bacterium]
MAGYLQGDRPATDEAVGERETLIAFLDLYRATLELKCEGLTPEQLAQRSVPPSSMSLVGLVRHLAEVERVWFRRWNGEQTEPRYYSKADPDGDFDNVDGSQEHVDDAFAYWRSEVEHARQVAAEGGLEVAFVHARDGRAITLRWILVHMIEEYARHCGHADLLRERIDGATGY